MFKETTMLVSILVPVFNKEPYLERCFISITKQLYQNIECIFIDDGSTDESYKKLCTLINNYSGNISFRMIKHEKNEGVSTARNTGILSAKGEYLYYLDADDEITENCILSLVELAKKYKDVDIVKGATYVVSKQLILANGRFPEYVNDSDWTRINYCVSPVLNGSVVNRLIRKNLIISNNLYFYHGIVHEDNLWNFFAAKKLKSIAFVNNICYNRYTISDSIMTNTNKSSTLQSWLIIIEEMIHNIDLEIKNDQIIFIYNILIENMRIIFRERKYNRFLPEYKNLMRRMNRYTKMLSLLYPIWRLKLSLFKMRIYSILIKKD
jgi:glycosyltransferase involved in cell wall biosynthesis